MKTTRCIHRARAAVTSHSACISAFAGAVVLLAGTARAALRSVNSWTVNSADVVANANWNAKGDLLVPQMRASGLALCIQRAGSTTPVELSVPDVTGLTDYRVFASDTLKYAVVEGRNGDIHHGYCYKIGSALTRMATYAWNGALSGGQALQVWCGDTFFVVQQIDAAGAVCVSIFPKGFKRGSNVMLPTHAGASSSPAVCFSPHGRYVALERAYNSVSGVREIEILRIADWARVLTKSMLGWPEWYGPDDNIIRCVVQTGSKWYEVDQLEPSSLLLQCPQPDVYDSPWIATKKTPLAAVMYTSNELLVRNASTVIGPHPISGVPAGAAVTCPFFDGKTIVLCSVQASGAYELRSFAITPAGFTQTAGPVAGTVLPYTRCDQSYVRLYEYAAAGATFRLMSKSLQPLGTLSTIQGIPALRGRTCMVLQLGASTVAFDVLRW